VRFFALFVALTVAAAPLTIARAADKEDDSGDDGAGRVSVAVFLLYDADLSRKDQADLSRGIERALKKNPKLAVKDKDSLLAEFAGEVPTDAVTAARGLRQSGEDLLGQQRPKEAIEKLAAAESAFEKVLAFAKKNELADVQFLLGVAYANAGDKKKALAAFTRLQVWRPKYVVDTDKYADALPLWEQAHKELDKLGRGSLEVTTDPDGVLVFVDGKYLGVAPLEADALPIGDHYVTLKLEGYQRKVVKAKVDPQYQELVTETLPKSEKYLLVEQSLGRARAALGNDVADVSMLDLRTFLFIDQAVFVRIALDEKKKDLVLDAYLYDLRSKKRLGEVTGGKIKDGEAATSTVLDDIAQSLYHGVRYDGKADVVVVHHHKKAAAKPFYDRWWFWTAVSVGAIAAGAAIYGESVSGGPTCPSGSTCGQVLLNF
jgi:tetratricopeptide (TPR) repeat protein